MCARRIRQPGSILNAGPCARLIRNTHVLQLFGGPVPVRELQHGGRRLSDGQIPGVQVSRVYVRAVQRHRRRLSGQMPRREWHWRDYYPHFYALHVWFVFYARVVIATNRRPMTHDATFGPTHRRQIVSRLPGSGVWRVLQTLHMHPLMCARKRTNTLQKYTLIIIYFTRSVRKYFIKLCPWLFLLIGGRWIRCNFINSSTKK